MDWALSWPDRTGYRHRSRGIRVRRSILAVDDEQKILDVLVRGLSPGYRVITARSIRDAVPALKAGVDILLCDVRLEAEHGLDLVRRAAAVNKIPRIIAMSGAASQKEAFALAAAGALYYLEKPFTIADVLRAIDEADRRTPSLDPFVAAWVGKEGIKNIEGAVRDTLFSQALARSNGNRSGAARLLGLSRQRAYQLEPSVWRRRARPSTDES
jgi:two-component system, cell cycle response regulator CpdR